MVLRMKNFNILEVHWKIWLLGGVQEKPIEGGDCLKRGAWTVCQFKGVLTRKSGVVFLRGAMIPQSTLCSYFKIYQTSAPLTSTHIY